MVDAMKEFVPQCAFLATPQWDQLVLKVPEEENRLHSAI